MAELYMPNMLAAFNEGQDRGRAQRFNRLAGQAYGAPEQERAALLQQAVSLDPQAGTALGDKLQDQDDANLRRAVGAARYVKQALDSKNPAAVKGAYAAVRPYLARMGAAQGLEPPAEWSDDMIPKIHEILARGNATQGAVPSGYREIELLTAGLSPEDRARAYRINLGLDPRAVTGAAKALTVKGADGRERQATFDPTTQSYQVFDEATNTFRPLGAGESISQTPSAAAAPPTGEPGSAGNPLPQGGTDPVLQQIIASANELAKRGVPAEQVDAWVQEQANRVNGGAPNPSAITPMNAPAQVVAPAPVPPSAARSAPASFGVSRSPEEQAALTTAAQEGAKNAADLAIYDEMTRKEAERARQAAAAKVEGEAQGQRTVSAPQAVAAANETIGLLDRVLTHPGRAAATGLSSSNPLNKIPGTPAYDFNVLLDQIKGQAFLQAFQSLRGGGAITEREGQAATNAIARLNAAQSEGEFATAINDLKRIVQAGRDRASRGSAPQSAPANASQQGQPPAAASDRQRAVMKALNEARDAVKRGASREAVKQRLIQMGFLKSAERL